MFSCTTRMTFPRLRAIVDQSSFATTVSLTRGVKVAHCKRTAETALSAPAYASVSAAKEYDWVPMSICTTYTACSSTAPNGASGTDLLNYGDTNRKFSSDTRNSSSPDDSNAQNTINNKLRRRKDNRPPSRGRRKITHHNGLISMERTCDSELPSVLDENITGTKLNPPSQLIKGGKSTGRHAVLKPLNSNDQLTTSNHTSHRQPLSISGLAKPDASGEDTIGAGWTHTQNSKVPTVTRPPVLTSHTNHNNSNSATSSSTNSTGIHRPDKSEGNGALSSLTVNATSSITYTNTYTSPKKANKQINNNNSKQPSRRPAAGLNDGEPKYADPITGASTSFQARLSELASLESETVRYERLRRLKKKNKDD